MNEEEGLCVWRGAKFEKNDKRDPLFIREMRVHTGLCSGCMLGQQQESDLSLTVGYKNLEKLVITHILHSLRNSKLISRLLERFVLFL